MTLAQPRRDRVLVRLTLLILVTCVTAACDQGERPSNLFLPTWTLQPGAAAPTGELRGHLDERNGCLFWSNGSDFLPLWPTALEIDRDELTIETTSGDVLAIGDGGILVGGERTLEQAESLIGEQIPSRCQAVGGYWMVTEVTMQ